MAIFAIAALVIAVVSLLVFWGSAASDAFNQRIDEINKTSGLSFSKELLLGNVSHGFIFDTVNKKICFLQGRASEVLDYGYIRSWQLSWDERPGNPLVKHTNICFTFGTNDLARPIIKIKELGKARAEEWSAKLQILFD